ncbi:MAG: FixH family protein, partial [Armatimonadetes bacterium]|nr:FixH family protein [Armatimonadota bacterium]
MMRQTARSPWLLALAALLMVVAGSAALAGLRADAGPYRVEITTDPAVIPVGRAKLILKVTDSAGKPVEGAQVSALAKMPGMDMGEREEPA